MKSKIIEIINEIIQNNHPDAKKITLMQVDEELLALGMDSIAYVQIIVSLEENFHIKIPDEKLLFSEMSTVNKILEVVSKCCDIKN